VRRASACLRPPSLPVQLSLPHPPALPSPLDVHRRRPSFPLDVLNAALLYTPSQHHLPLLDVLKGGFRTYILSTLSLPFPPASASTTFLTTIMSLTTPARLDKPTETKVETRTRGKRRRRSRTRGRRRREREGGGDENGREAEATENERETDTERVECERALHGLSTASPTPLLPLNVCPFSSTRPHLSREGSSSRYSEASS
jgi:hypothetical protein